jgi:O-antigen/teichoic acid export membrane protein
VSRWIAGSTVLTWTSSNLFLLSAPMYYGAAAAGVLKASQNIMGPANIWFLGLENVVPAETARRLHSGGIHSMLAYTRSILVKWGGLTILFAASMSLVPGFWLKLTYGPEMAQYGYVLRLYALVYVISFVGGPLRAGLQALEFTVPIFWSYLVMTALAFTFAVPMAKWLGLSGSLVGLIGAQVLFQSIVGISLLLRSRHMLKQQEFAPSSPTSVD